LHFNPQSTANQCDQGFIKNRTFQLVIVVLLFATALGIRLYHINRPALDFSPIRQYQNAHIIRGLYFERNDSIAESRKQIAKLNMERMGFVLEPRIIENLSVIGYRIMGAEHLWIPRVLSSVFWVVGGIFLYLTACMMLSSGIALFSTCFYLFLPYGILASRSIQPDPLMVMMMLFSIYRVLKYDENPSRINLVTAAVITAIAVLIKPYCIFMIFGAFFSLSVLRMGFWKASFNRNTFIFSFLIILPSVVYYGYGLLTGVGFLGEHAKSSFLPHLLVYPPFWSGWLSMIGDVVGYIAFFLAMIGLLSVKQGRFKTMLLGLWTGYFLFGLSATFQIHTHNYYSMPFIPIVALSLGPIANVIINRKASLLSMRLNKKLIPLVLILIVLGLGFSIQKLRLINVRGEYKSKLRTIATFIGINPEFSKFLRDDFESEVRIAKEIGDYVGHSTNTVFLDSNFGRVLAYYGDFSGLPWPTRESLYERRLRGVQVPDIRKDFTSKHIKILYHGKFITYTPDYFIVTALDEFNKQTDLTDFLNSNFPVLVKSDDYLIFDLRRMSE
jgi:hypothetical protein